MSKRVWTGVVAGVLSARVLLSVGLVAYQAGERHEVVTSTVPDGEVVRVIDSGWGWGHGPGPFFFLFPLFGILLVVLLVRGARGWGGGWGPGGWRGGPYGYGPEGAFQEWHRRAHERDAGPGDSDPARMER